MKRSASRGMQIIHMTGLFIIGMMFSAVAIDFGYYFSAHNQLQTVADAAALSATMELYKSEANSSEERLQDVEDAASAIVDEEYDLMLDPSDVEYGFVDPRTKTYDEDSFGYNPDPAYDATGGYNAIRVKVRRSEDSGNGPISTLFARMLNIETMDVGAESIGLVDQNIDTVNSGLRPIYVCQGQFEMAMQDDNPENNVIRIYGNHVQVDGESEIPNCPDPTSGNWSFADFRDCSSGTAGSPVIAGWMANGYPDPVHANQCYSTRPGNFIGNREMTDALDSLILNGDPIMVPLYDSWQGGGATGQVNISGFAAFVVTSYEPSGPQAGRHIEGYFTRTICTTCSSNGNGALNPGGAVVKLRLVGGH